MLSSYPTFCQDPIRRFAEPRSGADTPRTRRRRCSWAIRRPKFSGRMPDGGGGGRGGGGKEGTATVTAADADAPPTFRQDRSRRRRPPTRQSPLADETSRVPVPTVIDLQRGCGRVSSAGSGSRAVERAHGEQTGTVTMRMRRKSARGSGPNRSGMESIDPRLTGVQGDGSRIECKMSPYTLTSTRCFPLCYHGEGGNGDRNRIRRRRPPTRQSPLAAGPEGERPVWA